MKFNGAVIKRMGLLLLLFSVFSSKAQISSTGKLFFMTFLEMETRTGWGGNPNPYPDTLLIFVTSEVDTKCKIDNPRLPGSSLSYNLKKGIVNRIAVDNVFYYPVGSEFNSADINSKKGLRLQSDDPVNVYCMNLELNRSDGTFIMPYESIPAAPEYYIVSFPPNVRNGSRYTESEFGIICMDASCKVEITPTADTKGGKPAGKAFTVNMQRGQVYQVQSDDADGTNNTDPAEYSWTGSGAKAGDMTGTKVRVINSCAKINVFSGTRSSYVSRGNCASGLNGKDHLYTQTLPTAALGKEYVLMPYANQRNGFVYRVVAAQDSTYVYINGTLKTMIPKAGDWITQEQSSDNAVSVTTSKPAYVAQYMKNGRCNGWNGSSDGDAAIFISADVNQRLLTTIVGTASTSNMKNHWVNILVDQSAKKAVKFNGSFLNQSVFNNVAGGKYAYAQVSVNNFSSNTISCDSGFVVVAYGTGPYESYSYSAGALFESVEYDFSITRKGKCPSEPVTLVEKNTKKVKAIKWNFGDGSPEEWGDSVVHKFSRIGSYYAVMKCVVENNCGVDDTVVRSKIINVLPGPVLEFPDTMTQCADKLNLTIEAPISNKFLYKWHDGSTKSFFEATSDQLVWVHISDTSTLCEAKDTTYVRRANTIKARFDYDSVNFCDTQNYFRLVDSTRFRDDAWAYSNWWIQDAITAKFFIKDSVRTFDVVFDTVSQNRIVYIVESQKGCRDTLDTLIEVHSFPVAELLAEFDPVACENRDITFIDSSQTVYGRGVTYWEFSDGTTDTNSNPGTQPWILHSFPSNDTFTYRMITETKFGCRDTVDSMIVVYPRTETAIGIKVVDLCLNQNEFEFYDNSLIDFGSFNDQWLIDGQTYDDKGALTNINFKDTGYHMVRLTTKTDYGCTDTIFDSVYVAMEPKAILVVTDSNQCLGYNEFTLECQSVAFGTNSLTSRSNWKFEDGTTAYAKIVPGKSFSASGKFWTRLIAETTLGCLDSTEVTLEVFEDPDATITPDNAVQCFTGNSFDFTTKNVWTNTSIGINQDWDFGDGTNKKSVASQPDEVFNKTYASAGSYLVTHIVTSAQGCADTATTNVDVVSSPAADFTMNKDTACFYSQYFTFTDITNYTGTYNVEWRYSDGTPSDFSSVVTGKKFTLGGKKNIKLLVTTSEGCTDSIEKAIEIFPVPVANFTINNKQQCQDNNSFVFSNTTNENGTNSCTYDWGILGPSTVTYNGKSLPNQTFTQVGTYDVGLLVTSDKNCVSSMTDALFVRENPTVSITGEDQCVFIPVQFTSNLTLNSGTATYNWNFDDGGSSNLDNPTHTYNQSGTYNASLVVTSNYGCTGTSNTWPLTIYEKPKASFTSEYLLSRGLETDWSFTSTGTGADNLNWYFEDGQFATGTGPIFKTFSSTGDFNVKLIASTNAGCADSITTSIFLKPELLMWIPNTFTPNEDGLNDNFGPSATFGLERYQLQIFDRWGAKIFETTDPENRWTGHDSEGVLVPEGVYGYHLLFRYVDNKLYVYKGTITVLY